MSDSNKTSFYTPHINIFRFLRDPELFQLTLLKKWGDPFPLHLPGLPPVWMTQNSERVKKIFTSPLGSFIPSVHNPVAPLLGNNGLIMLGGNEHTQSRKDLGPNFMGQQLKKLGGLISDVYSEVCNERILIGQPIVLQEFAQALALRIVLRLIFPHISLQELWDLEKTTKKFLESYKATLLFTPKWVPGTWSVFTKCKNNFDDLFFKYYLTGKELNIEGPIRSIAGKNPSKEQVLDQLRTLVVAGHETTATSLVWVIYLIHQERHMEVKATLMDEINNIEIDQIEKINELVFLEAVVNEALRIHPPVPFITRKIVDQFEMGTRTFSRDEEIGVSICLLQRSLEIWKDPDRFYPQRFIDKKYSPHEFAPFGGSNRKCIGAGLAMSELKILTALMLKNYKIKLCSEDSIRPKVMQITIGPKKPIILEIRTNI